MTNRYHIYGRKAYEKPLEFVGELELDDAAALKEETLAKFGADDWVELVGIPTAAWIYVTQKETVAS